MTKGGWILCRCGERCGEWYMAYFYVLLKVQTFIMWIISWHKNRFWLIIKYTHPLQPPLCPNEVCILSFCPFLVLLLGRNCNLMWFSTQTQRSLVTTASFISFISLLPRSYHKAFHHKLPGLQEHHDSLHISNTTRLANMGHSVMYTLFGSGSLVTVCRVVCLISLCCNYCFFIWQIF